MSTLPMSASSKVHWRRRCGHTGQPRQDRQAELRSRTAASRPPGSRYTSASVRSVTANPRLPSFSGVGTASCKADRNRGKPGLPLCRHCFRAERQRSGRPSSTSRRNSSALAAPEAICRKTATAPSAGRRPDSRSGTAGRSSPGKPRRPRKAACPQGSRRSVRR
jgi:hypothetical protein